jgi:hypothetical protein
VTDCPLTPDSFYVVVRNGIGEDSLNVGGHESAGDLTIVLAFSDIDSNQPAILSARYEWEVE